jgi:tetratricopeptide (TPR) repeat protein
MAFELAPNSESAHFYLAWANLHAGRFEEAIPHYRECIRIHPGHRWSQWGLGHALKGAEQFDEALVWYCRSMPAEPSQTAGPPRGSLLELLRGILRPRALEPLDGFIDAMTSQYIEADLAPINLELLALAYIHAPQRRDPERALALAARAVEQSAAPSGLHRSIEPLATLASVEFHAGRRRDAIQRLEDDADLFASASARAVLTELREALQPDLATLGSIDELCDKLEHDRAELSRRLRAFLERDTDAALGAHARGRLALLDERLDEARRCFEQARTAAPDRPEPALMLASCLQRAGGSLPEAAQLVREAHAAARGPTRARALRLAAELGIAIPLEPGLIRRWRIAGPLPGQTAGAPPLDGGGGLPWRDHLGADPLGRIDLIEACGEAKDAHAFLHTEVRSAAAQDVTLRLGSNDGLVCWLNGRELHRNPATRALKPEQDLVPARLEAGVNRLLLCVSNSGWDWAVSLRITNSDGQPVALEQ